jgi:rRNA maturation endonuclease Nob1
MTTVFIADTGVFVRSGGPDNEKFQQLRRALRQAGVSLRIPQRVYEELSGDPEAESYPSGNLPHPDGIEDGWITVAEELDYTNSRVSRVMDETRRFIANETDRDEDRIEKADTALVALAAQLLDTGEADSVVLVTTDKPAGKAAETILADHGFAGSIEYRYASEESLETITAAEFQSDDQ